MSSQESISTLKPATVSMAMSMKKKLKVGKDGIVEADEDLYESTLADAGLDIATVKKVQQHNSEVVSALTLAVGEAGIDAMKKNQKIDMVTAEVKAGRDEIEVCAMRSRDVNDMKNPGQKMTQYGATTVRYTVRGTANSGELKKVRSHLMNQAAGVLGN